MYELEEVNKYFLDEGFDSKVFTPQRIKELHSMIEHVVPRINDLDKKWVACSQNHEKDTVDDAIEKIIKKYDSTINTSFIELSRDTTCKIFKNKELKMKHRIPFYIVLLDLITKKKIKLRDILAKFK